MLETMKHRLLIGWFIRSTANQKLLTLSFFCQDYKSVGKVTLFYQRFFSLVILVLFPNVKHWWLVMVSWHFIIRVSSSVTMVQFWLVIAWERKGFDSSKNNCVCFIISLKKIQVTKGQIMCKLGKVFWETESVFPIHFQFFI